MGFEEDYLGDVDFRDNESRKFTKIKCTNCDGQAFIKLVEKWTDIFRQWDPKEEEKEKIWDKFYLEIIDEADMPAPFDKYFRPWERGRSVGFAGDDYGKRVCVRGKSETGATVWICVRSNKGGTMWDRFVLYKPSGKEKTMLTYIVTDEYSPKKLDEIKDEEYWWRQLNMNFYLDFDKGDGNYLTVEGTGGKSTPKIVDRDKNNILAGVRQISRPYRSRPSWAEYALGLKDSKGEDAGYSDFHSMDVSLFKKLDEASDSFFAMLQENKDALGALGLARQEKMKHMSEEERAEMERQKSLLNSLDSI
ncbi:MAG: hypothetical protein SOZ84_04755 [Treponema sp.]|nr:hypothetical protein [Treponema sp.]